MGKKRVVLLKTNLLDIDPRLSKEISILRDEYRVTFLGWDRDRKSRNLTETDGHSEIHFHFKAPFGTSILFFMPIWWCFVFWVLMTTRWDVVHAINLDTLIPALIAARLKRKPLIYEIFDVYVDVIVLPIWIRQIGIGMEKLLMRPATGIILANEGQPAELNGIPHRNVVKIINTPPDTLKISDHYTNHNFLIFFAGGLFIGRRHNIDKVYEAIQKIDDTKIVVAGYGDNVNEIQQLSRNDPHKIEFLGTLAYPEVLKRTLESNLTFALYDPIVPTTRYAGCNKLFEAMMAGKPILVSKGTTMEEIVNREQCGLAIDPYNINEIRETIIRLKGNAELCYHLGANGRKAYEEKYSWNVMKQRLLDFYKQIAEEINRNEQ